MKFYKLLNYILPKKVIVTHDATFHADEIMACAIISLYEKDRVRFIRTRDESIFKKADYLIDVGGIYDHELKKYDHHQIGGAGKRENGIEYASAGLVWKHYGKEIIRNSELLERIDAELMRPIDMEDNGQSKFYSDFTDTFPYTLSSIVNTRKPTWRENDQIDTNREFANLVTFFKDILIREIEINRDEILAKKQVVKVIESAENENYIVLDSYYPFNETLADYPHILYVAYPRKDGSWGAQCVTKERGSFENRKPFPSAWGGLQSGELKKITGIPDARFCHRSLFLCVAETKKGAIDLIEKSLMS